MKTWTTKLYGAEFKISRLQDAAQSDTKLDQPEFIVNWLTPQLATSLRYNTDTENLMAVYFTARLHPISWEVISNGSLDTLLVHAREVFRAAIVMNAHSLVLLHNPSGDPTPSEADIKITRDLIRAGQTLKIDLRDHIILGQSTPSRPRSWASLRELGYFCY